MWRKASSGADSGRFSATDVDDASRNAAAFSSPKHDREMTGEVEVHSYVLFSPRGRKRLTKGGFYGPGCFNNSVEDRLRVLLFAETHRTKVRAREALADMEQDA